MIKTLVRVLAQYINENGKMKGSQEFTFRVDADFLMYTEKEEIASIIQKMIDIETANFEGKCVYIEHDLVFHEPIELKSDFEKLFHEMHKEKTPAE